MKIEICGTPPSIERIQQQRSEISHGIRNTKILIGLCMVYALVLVVIAATITAGQTIQYGSSFFVANPIGFSILFVLTGIGAAIALKLDKKQGELEYRLLAVGNARWSILNALDLVRITNITMPDAPPLVHVGFSTKFDSDGPQNNSAYPSLKKVFTEPTCPEVANYIQAVLAERDYFLNIELDALQTYQPANSAAAGGAQ